MEQALGEVPDSEDEYAGLLSSSLPPAQVTTGLEFATRDAVSPLHDESQHLEDERPRSPSPDELAQPIERPPTAAQRQRSRASSRQPTPPLAQSIPMLAEDQAMDTPPEAQPRNLPIGSGPERAPRLDSVPLAETVPVDAAAAAGVPELTTERRFRPRKAAQLKPFSYDMAQHAREFAAAGFKPMRFRGLPDPLLQDERQEDAAFVPPPPSRPPRRPSRSVSPQPNAILLAASATAKMHTHTKKAKRRVHCWRDINRFDYLLKPADRPASASAPLLALNNWNAQSSPVSSDHEEISLPPPEDEGDVDFAFDDGGGTSTPAMAGPRPRRCSPTPLSTSSDGDSDASPGNAPAHLVQQIRKRTKGVLPASFKFFAETPAAALNRLAKPGATSRPSADAVRVRGKAVRKDKTGHRTQANAIMQLDPSSSSESDVASLPTFSARPVGSVRTSLAGRHASSTPQVSSSAARPIFIDADSDMEQEEQIDRMLARPTPRPRLHAAGQAQTKTKRKRQSRLEEHRDASSSHNRGHAFRPRGTATTKRAKPARKPRPPDLFIGDFVDAFRERSEAPRDVRLAHRAVRLRGAEQGTQLSRKYFNFDDVATRRPGIAPAPSSEEDAPRVMLKRWAQGTLPVEGKRAQQQQQKRQKQIQRQKPAPPAEPRRVRPKKASTVRSAAFFLDDDDTLPRGTDGPSLPLGVPRPPALPKHAKHVPFFTSRTFQTTLEQETGRVALPAQKQVSTRPARPPAYLRNLLEINNLFEEDDFAAKISHWQARAPTQEKVAVKMVRPVSPDLPAHTHRLQRKLKATRRAPVQQTLAPFVAAPPTQASEPDATAVFSSTAVLTDVSLGCEPLPVGCFFMADTVVGAELQALLGDGRFLSLCYFQHARYDIEHASQLVERLFPYVEQALRSRQQLTRDDYDAFRFLAQCHDGRLKGELFGKTNELRQLASLSGSMQTQSWLSMFCLFYAFQMAQANNAWDQFSLVVESVLGFLLTSTLDPLETLLRRQRDETNRAKGISAEEGGMLECWIVLFHLCGQAALTPEGCAGFWLRINRRLELQRCSGQAYSERAWKTLLLLSSVTAFDLGGRSDRPLENWECVLALLEKVMCDYAKQMALPTSAQHDAYIRLSLRRCHRLIDVFRWPDCGKLLQGKVGGVLHDFFWRQLSLSNLQHEQGMYETFPSFLLRLDDAAGCLAYEQGNMDSTFSTFLKVLCLALRQLQDSMGEPNRRSVMQLTALVDKFQTFGPMNASAEADLSIAQLGQMRNRFAVEIAIYWAAGAYKHQDLSRLLETSAAHMTGSHLELRRVNIQAWGIVVRLQLQRDEDGRLPASIQWLRHIFQTTVDDVKRFAVELGKQHGQQQHKALQDNISRCHQVVSECLHAYRTILALRGSQHSLTRLRLFWLSDLLTAILQNQAAFHRQKAASNQEQLEILQEALSLIFPLVEGAGRLLTEDESQDLGFDFSQDEEGNALVDVQTLVKQDIRDMAQLAHRFLSDVFSSGWRYERDASGDHIPKELPVTALLIQQCKMGIDALYRCVKATRLFDHSTWSSLFDRHGPVSWWRLPESAASARVLPYYLALLLRREPSFYDEMGNYVVAVWLGSMANPDVRGSLATLTNELLKVNDKLVNVGDMTAALLDQYRISYIDSSLKLFVKTDLELARDCVASLTDTVKTFFQAIMDSEDKAFYLSFTHAILRIIIEYCARAIELVDISSLGWLLDARNLEQPAGKYQLQRLRSFAYVELEMHQLELLKEITALCEGTLLSLDGPSLQMVSQAVGTLEGRPWNHDLAALRRFLVTGIYIVIVQLASTLPTAVLYASAMSAVLQVAYEQLTAECLIAGEAVQAQLAHELCQLVLDLPDASPLATVFVRLLEQHLAESCGEIIAEFKMVLQRPRFAVQPPEIMRLSVMHHLELEWALDGSDAVHLASGKRIALQPEEADGATRPSISCHEMEEVG